MFFASLLPLTFDFLSFVGFGFPLLRWVSMSLLCWDGYLPRCFGELLRYRLQSLTFLFDPLLRCWLFRIP